MCLNLRGHCGEGLGLRMRRLKVSDYSAFLRVRAIFLEDRNVMTDRNGQPDWMIRAFSLIILPQLFAQPSDFHPDNRILFFIEVGGASESRNANGIFLQQIG